MIYNQTILKVSDNTGVKKTKCIKIYKNKDYSKIGEIILVTIKKIKKTEKKKKINIEKSNKIKGIIIRTKKTYKNIINNDISFYENSIVCIDQKNEPIGNKIFGPVPFILKKKKLFKIILIASVLV